jgi:hypothetical protein
MLHWITGPAMLEAIGQLPFRCHPLRITRDRWRAVQSTFGVSDLVIVGNYPVGGYTPEASSRACELEREQRSGHFGPDCLADRIELPRACNGLHGRATNLRLIVPRPVADAKLLLLVSRRAYT